MTILLPLSSIPAIRLVDGADERIYRIRRILLWRTLRSLSGVEPVRVWIGPMGGREGGVDRYIRTLVANSAHRFKTSKEFPMLLWGLRWVGRTIPVAGRLYGEYLHRARGIEVAHVHRSATYAEAFKQTEARLPWLYTLHGIGFEEHWRHRPDVVRWIREAKELALQSVRLAPLATVVSRWLKEWVEERTGTTVTVTPPGVDFREVDSVGSSEFLEWSGQQPGFLLWVGRLAFEKRLDWFIELAERLPERRFVALADSSASRFREKYWTRIPSNFRYYGRVPRPLVVSAFHACSVHVNTSLYDAAPTTLVEAMACGKAVVASDNVGAREIQDESGACFLFDTQSLADLEERTRAALNHPEVGARGLAFAKEKRDWAKLVGFFDRQYEALARRS